MNRWIRHVFLLAISTALTLASGAHAKPFGDAQIGQVKSPSCVFCHGSTGQSANPNYPHLNGQDATYLFNAMRAYQLDERTGPLAQMMKAQLSKLNEQDLRDIAAFYAAQED